MRNCERLADVFALVVGLSARDVVQLQALPDRDVFLRIGNVASDVVNECL